MQRVRHCDPHGKEHRDHGLNIKFEGNKVEDLPEGRGKMIVIAWLTLFILGWSSDRWSIGLTIAPLSASIITVSCLFMTNNPALTSIERHIEFTVESITLNFLVKMLYSLIFFTIGYICQKVWERLIMRRKL